MAKKNLGKVKRYRRSFYSGRQRAARIAGGVVALVALFAVGWLAGPAVINFGTSTWYSIVRGDSDAQPASEPESASVPQSASEPESQPASEPQPTAAPQADGDMTQGSWAFVDVASLTGEGAAEQVAQQLAGQGVTYAVVPLKDSTGIVYYASALPAAASSLSTTQIDGAAVAAVFKEQGIVPVAGVCAFQDPLAASANREMAVKYQGTDYLWLDAAQDKGGKAWLNPYSSAAVDYIGGIIDEAKAMGFEQIWLTAVQLPTTAGRDKASYGDTAGVTEAQCLANALAAWQEKATCWVEYPLNVASGQETRLTGGTIDALGIENLAIEVSGELTEETQTQLDTAKAAAAGCDYVGVRTGDVFAVEAGQ